MKGKVHANEARLQLKVLGPSKKVARVEAIIDTGFSGWLTLPKPMIDWLGLQFIGPGRVQLGNCSIVDFDVYEVRVQWNRSYQRIFVDESPCTPLVGMSLLSNCELNMQVRQGGKVTIRPLAKRHRKAS
jgi:clan AA aspartic protease